jgi:pimeloyl-ACP methyl ester carboxylesterase
MRATFFPRRAARSRVPVVVVEPIFLRKEILCAGDGSAIDALTDGGFDTWLVWTDTDVTPDARRLARGIAQTVTSIASETGSRELDLVGTSLGAEATLRALDLLTSPGAPVVVRRVAFVGGGFDYAYPGSFGARARSLAGGPATQVCAMGGDAGAHQFHDAAGAARWLGAVPPSPPDALDPARARFAFAARWTQLPVLIVAGKADGIAPSESSFPLYELWGNQAAAATVPKLFFLAGRANNLNGDLDHLELFAGPGAASLWRHVTAWLARD